MEVNGSVTPECVALTEGEEKLLNVMISPRDLVGRSSVRVEALFYYDWTNENVLEPDDREYLYHRFEEMRRTEAPAAKHFVLHVSELRVAQFGYGSSVVGVVNKLMSFNFALLGDELYFVFLIILRF